MKRQPYLIALVLVSAAVTVNCRSPWDEIRPVIHAKEEERIAAMRSAPIIILAEIQHANLFGRPRDVEKPPEVAGPMVPRIPLHLAYISAKVLRTLRGPDSGHVEFYSWVWASGKHGGPRLFHPNPGSVHILFLKGDAGYLHTVGDYPAYDLEIRSQWLPAFLTHWRDYERGAGLIERVVAVRLKAELESISTDRSEYWRLAELTSHAFVAGQLDSLCHSLTSPRGRTQACAALAELFPKY